MRYASLFSGIEAASFAWGRLGWQGVFLSEIEPFPCKLLAHRYPHIPNYGDINGFKDWPEHRLDLIIGGSPCQAFSTAGLRRGLDDPRGNLMLAYIAVIRRYRPRWVIWENVPGALSVSGGAAFATLLWGLEDCGYHAAWRVLDAQHVRTPSLPRGIAQRRRRVFLVGHNRDWAAPAEVLFDEESSAGEDEESTHAWCPREVAGRATYGISKFGLFTAARVSPTVTTCGFKNAETLVAEPDGVRRLSPREYERIMGFSDDYTRVPGATDSTRCKALGNSMATNCIEWLGLRIQKVENRYDNEG